MVNVAGLIAGMVAVAAGMLLARVHFPEESYGYYARWIWVPVLVGAGLWSVGMSVFSGG